MPSLVPAEITNKGQQQVDYFSYDFDPLDLHSCWKMATRHKNNMVNGRRLENLSWRRFWRLKNKLKTVDPASLNWHKDRDTQWLYGPLFNFQSLRELEEENRKTYSTITTILRGNFNENLIEALRSFKTAKRTVSNLESISGVSYYHAHTIQGGTPTTAFRKNSDPSQRPSLIKPSKSLTNLANLFSPAIMDVSSPKITNYNIEEDSEQELPVPISISVIPKGVNKAQWVQTHVNSTSRPASPVNKTSPSPDSNRPIPGDIPQENNPRPNHSISKKENCTIISLSSIRGILRFVFGLVGRFIAGLKFW